MCDILFYAGGNIMNNIFKAIGSLTFNAMLILLPMVTVMAIQNNRPVATILVIITIVQWILSSILWYCWTEVIYGE